jgi:phosphate:Na+ symporter
MSSGMSPLRELPAFHSMLAEFSIYPLLGILCGAVFTALIQSSSAATGVIIAMTMQDLIPFQSAVPLILGTNIGTCVTAILASIGANVAARRAAVAHVLFNLIGVVLAYLLLTPFMELIVHTASTVPRQVANTHTAFNLFNTVIFLIFLNPFTGLICRIVPGEDKKIEFGPKYLDKRILKTPAVAIGGAKQELLRMAGIAREMLDESMQVFLKSDLKKVKHIEQMEDLVDGLEKEINIYLADLSQHSMSKEQSGLVAGFLSAANDLERIGDHATNITQLSELKTEERLPFSSAALEEITALYNKVDTMLAGAIRAFEQEDLKLAREIVAEDDEVDAQEKTLRKRHIDRINTKKCYPASGVIYLDLLSNLERVADHANNIAYVVIDGGRL